jgi:hypothetical protein
MVTGFPFSDEWQSPRMVLALLDIMRSIRHTQQWNRYVLNWPIALDALHRLWKTGRVSELKTPFYEPLEKLANK